MRFDPLHYPYPSRRNAHCARRGMVCTTQPLAAQAGLEILKSGGNAIDAAIATAACLSVVEPTSNGIGGDAFALVWTDNRLHGLNASGPSPGGISIEAVKAMGHEAMPRHGFVPVTVPGAVGGWAALSKRFGKLSLAQCLAPAVAYAREGFPLSPTVGKYWGIAFRFFEKYKNDPAFAPWFETFAPQNRAPQAGEMWASPAHAQTLAEIGETQGESFYRGRLAKEIADFSRQHQGFLSLQDLNAYAPAWEEPISVNYRGYTVWEMPPNGQGIVALMALGMLENLPETCHHQIEALKMAFARGMASVTDPAHMPFTTAQLLDEAYLTRLCQAVTETAQAPTLIPPEGSGTVYLATADGDGNMVSFIQSNYMGFGSGIVIPHTGIAMQNRGADFHLDPAHPNALAGNKRCYHTIIPGFLTRDGQALGPFGVMGGYMQPQGHLQVLSHLIDKGLNPQAALDAPRWQWTKGRHILIEPDFPPETAAQLAAQGHEIETAPDTGSFGRGQIILRNPATGVLTGGTEPRADGAIATW
ncbi:MAG: gamma-glutamyltransferase family protein [Defluviitaleaceae bacterium]|nr:gamma-glutamyltransferase family protein [Defluviitaleaceae bacterium]MCL2240597.1 gamma-glutamyltransferase family protein [Defluviitaleaceae bacterium]